MRLTTSDLSSRLMFPLMAAWIFIAPSGQAVAQTRSFQMAMWANSDGSAGEDTDIQVFYDTVGQPDGRSILIWRDINKPIYASEYTWSRIVAVLFDEPYNDFNGVSCWSTPTVAAVNARAQVLADRAAELKSVAPYTRFWVNLARPQTSWFALGPCRDEGSTAPLDVNRPYIDVISVDIYHEPFNTGIRAVYDLWALLPARPDQQVALIPGTFYRLGKDNPARQASYLQDYFDYANNANQNCNLPYGERGVTGNFDGCRVWMVMGWLAENYSEGGTFFVGMRDPSAAPIAVAWRAQRALPLHPDLANQVHPADLIPALVTPVLHSATQ